MFPELIKNKAKVPTLDMCALGLKRTPHRGLRLSRGLGSSVLRGGEGRPGKAEEEEKTASGSGGSPGRNGERAASALATEGKGQKKTENAYFG